jgi:hemophore-related protein
MIKLGLTRLGVGVGGLALSLTAGVGVASADPDLGSAVNSTCTYSQFVAALNAQNPTYGSALNSSPPMQADLQTFLAERPASERRQRFAKNVANNPAYQQLLPILQTAFDTCNNF